MKLPQFFPAKVSFVRNPIFKLAAVTVYILFSFAVSTIFFLTHSLSTIYSTFYAMNNVILIFKLSMFA